MKKILLSMFLLGTLLSANAQVPSYVPSNGLVGWWPFNGNANDESGNGNNGTNNGAMLTTDRNGISNSAFYFSGASCSTRIDASINTSSITAGFTLSFWSLKSGAGCSSPRLIEFWPGNIIAGYLGIAQDPGANPVIIKQITSSSTIGYLNFNYAADNVWAHYVYTNDGSNIKMYQNGLLISTTPSIGNISLASNASFGRMNHPANDAHEGKLDDIGIWNRALDSNEIKLLFKGCDRKITQQPINISTSNKKVSFTCQANDTLQTYQWQILENGTWVGLKDSAQFLGTKTSKMMVSQLLSKNNSQKFRCVIKGNCLNSISQVATLTYNCNGNITSQPSNQGMFAGNATFTCSSNDTLINYQWQTNSGTGWNNLFNAGQYAGSNSKSLLVSNVTLSNNNQLFRCIIKGDCLTDTTIEVSLRVWGLSVQSEQVQAFNVYPNPTKGQVTIENGDIAKMIDYTVSIYNSIGQQVFQSNITQQQYSLDITQWGGNGLYFMELKDNNGNIIDIKKIVLQ